MKLFFYSIIFILLHISIAAQNLSIERIWKNYEFSAKGGSAYQMMNDGEQYVFISEEGGILMNPISAQGNEQQKVLVPKENLVWNGNPISIAGFELNASEDKILLWTAPKAIYRRSFEAFYYLFDLKSKQLEALDTDHAPQTLAEYSPDGKKVSFIHGNDLFIKDLSTGKVQKITTDGKRNKIINGTTDWVYEEEFAITKAYGWSPDSRYLAFLKFDEREVPEFQMALYGDLYPEQYKYKYPKAGEKNANVTLHLYSVSSKSTDKIALGAYEYIPRIKWSNDADVLVANTLNRHQNNLKLHKVNAKNLTASLLLSETDKAYIDVTDNLTFLNDNSFIWTSEKDGFNHIYHYNFKGKLINQVTKGNWEVTQYYGFNENKNTIYYQSVENGSINRGIYSIDLDGKNNPHPVSVSNYING